MIGRFPTLISLLIFSLLLSFPTAAAEEWVCVSSEQPGFHIQDVAVSGDGAFRAITGDGGVILLTPAGRELWRSPDGRYRSVALSGDGDILVAGGDGLLVRHKNGTVLATVPSRYFVNGVAVNADGSRIAAVFEDETLRLYNATGVLLETTDTGDDLVSVAISPEGTYIAGGTDTGNVVFYSDTGEERWTYRLSSQPVTSLAMAEGGRTIAAVSEDGAAILLSRAGSLLWTGTAPHSGGVAVTADGAIGAIADMQDIRFMDRDGTHVGRIEEAVTPISFAMDDAGTYVMSTDGTRIYCFERGCAGAPDVSACPDVIQTSSSPEVPTGTVVEGTPAGGIPTPTRSPAPLLATVGGLLFGGGCSAAGRWRKK
ncbi:WD40 repeat domain-containing protein [Methanogenium organophilum]|uniref:WD40 repeat domain-containing protein n=1 Tax=Methanogenium organophilum TaxID=2199 RepID=A0A9X9S5Q1_METOG|nr:WD40 repeat domain-containing protein [Methanogenium organophilum]WAI02419.1 WD40 repeat domain-containing protein [Methanogenium organophilum]